MCATQDEDGDEKFVRWQRITLQQLTYAINLILGFSGAAIGFEISISFSDHFALPYWYGSLYLLSLVVLAISIAFGVSTVITRLSDFRMTAKIARLKPETPSNHDEIERLRGKTELLGKISWCLFYAQISSFSVGILLGAVVLFPMVAARAM